MGLDNEIQPHTTLDHSHHVCVDSVLLQVRIENVSDKTGQVSINGIDIEPGTGVALADHDIFAVGGRQFRFDYGE